MSSNKLPEKSVAQLCLMVLIFVNILSAFHTLKWTIASEWRWILKKTFLDISRKMLTLYHTQTLLSETKKISPKKPDTLAGYILNGYTYSVAGPIIKRTRSSPMLIGEIVLVICINLRWEYSERSSCFKGHPIFTKNFYTTRFLKNLIKSIRWY